MRRNRNSNMADQSVIKIVVVDLKDFQPGEYKLPLASKGFFFGVQAPNFEHNIEKYYPDMEVHRVPCETSSPNSVVLTVILMRLLHQMESDNANQKISVRVFSHDYAICNLVCMLNVRNVSLSATIMI